MEIRKEEGCGRPKVRINPDRHLKQLLNFIREFQLFLIGYIITQICEIFTVGGFPLDSKVRMVK